MCGWPLKAKVELRAMTKSHLMRERPVMMSSTIPSVKYSCSESPLMFWKGSTAIEGLSGNASGAAGFSNSTGSLCVVGFAWAAVGERPAGLE
jgi:hypothetical protein